MAGLSRCLLNAVFAQWAADLSGCIDGRVVAVDGKTVRGSKAGRTTPLHLISAYCDDLRLVLGQRASGHKKNEIKDIPKLLDLLYLKGAIVTLDAMGCQRDIAWKIRDKGADYVLALKGNQGSLHRVVFMRMWLCGLKSVNMTLPCLSKRWTVTRVALKPGYIPNATT